MTKIRGDRIRGLASAALAVAWFTSAAAAQDTLRVSVSSSGHQSNGDSDFWVSPAISADGKTVAFYSQATNLVPADLNNVQDIFVRDRVSGTTERVSVDSSGTEANGDSLYPSISADGQVVAFASLASNLVSGDTNATVDIFVHDRSTGVTERVSVDSTGAQGNGYCYYPTISADGRVVAFGSDASNLVAGDTNARTDVFVHDRTTGATERVSVDSSGGEGNYGSGTFPKVALSPDGQLVAFDSAADNLVAGDVNLTGDIFVHDRATGLTELISVDSAGVQGNDLSYDTSLSADGRFVAFRSQASNLVSGDTNSASDIFVRDRTAGTTERISVSTTGQEANLFCESVSISGDGSLVTFFSGASNLVPGDTGGFEDAFVHDRSRATTERISVNSNGGQGNSGSGYPALSADGLVVVFDSYATNLVTGDTNGKRDVFVHEFCSTPAAWSNYGAGFPGTNGVPSFTSRQNPTLGSTVTLDLANSYGSATVGLLFVGFKRTTIHSGWGGDLLVVPALTLPVSLSPGSSSYTGSIPADRQLCNVTVDLQAIEADPGAAKGVSFTPGLELLIGE
jgi:Tol biopolymer transport system component